jgi:1-aminocyclopropane-1-carboxylate deaminase/D-cysteine desulfhydrase-like pyridoxal-dependent ACC family enzyme
MDLDGRLAAVPRVRLGQFPTPLERLPRLTAALGGPRLWVKRDDAVGPAMGGNKTRKLEFLFGEAQACGAAVVATFCGLQSNFARQMCAAARGLGIEAHCFYFAPRPACLEGNLLLADLLGARLHFVPFGAGGDGGLTVERASRVVRLLVSLTPGCLGRRTYFMPVGGHCLTGALGYVAGALELTRQLAEQGLERATIVTAAGTGGTLAGLLAGQHLIGSRYQLLGIDVGKLWRGFPESVASLATELCGVLGQPYKFSAAQVPMLEGTYVGAGYAQPTPESTEAIRRLARTEGLLLDPVYTSKAMAGLIDQVGRGRWRTDEDVVFLHTGGLPAMWAGGASLTPDTHAASVPAATGHGG